MTELEILKRAKDYIDSLAQGKNPLDGMTLSDDDIVNNVRISRCLFYVSGVLQKVIDNGGEVQRQVLKRSEKEHFSLTAEQMEKLEPFEYERTVSQLAAYLNSFIDPLTMRKLQAASINRWLISAGFLSEERDSIGKMQKRVTAEGVEIGIREEKRSHDGRTYIAISHSPQAQQFLFDNISAIIEYAAIEYEDRQRSRMEKRSHRADSRVLISADDE